MPSSISSSEPVHPIRKVHVVIILATVLLCLVAIEACTRFAFARFSRIERRIMTEHASTMRLAQTPSARPVVLVGDSLLLEDVDMNLLAQSLSADLHLQRFPIEQTSYLDWLYGLRRIFAEGVRPSTVVLCINPNSFISNGLLGDYAAYYLFQTADIPAAAHAAGYDLTRESSLFFSHYSLFYAGRSGLRNFVLNRADPAYGNLLHTLLTRAAPTYSPEDVLRILEPRFAEMKKLCAAHSARFVYLMPPGFGFPDDALVEAATRAGASALVPVKSGAWPEEKFRDRFHLSEAGAKEFTQLAAPALDPLLQLPAL